MLKDAVHLKGFVIRAQDGELGTVDEFYFDDETWGVRYLIVNTGGWLDGRRVLISPLAVIGADWEGKRLEVALTKKQVEDSPKIDTQQTVSRQHEAEYLSYFMYPYYWGSPDLLGSSFGSPDANIPADTAPQATGYQTRRDPKESHLRSSEAVTGYRIEAADGEIGHLSGFILDDEAWAIRYIQVATQNWWPGKQVLVSPVWIERVSWEERSVYLGLAREDIQSGPAYSASTPITREYENQLYLAYRRPPYWLHEPEMKSAAK